ncbi:MAG: phosphoenolpyruvate synthase [Candidatus Paceibacterota bacterium]|jgi:pyruvate,water dikinase
MEIETGVEKEKKQILWFKDIIKKDVALVGGKNASLGEMFSNLTSLGVNIPNGFALTSTAFWDYLQYNGIDQKLAGLFEKLDCKNLKSLKQTSKQARDLVMKGSFPKEMEKEILAGYRKLGEYYKERNAGVAVRSSATAEDLADASFAGQHETYLNVFGKEALLSAIKKCLSSLYLERAFVYREEKGFDHLKVALSVCVQKMVRSDIASAGIMFTLDTESGFRDIVSISSIYGVGELIVKGRITSDQFYVFKPTLKMGKKSIISKTLGRKEKKYVYSKKGGLKETAVPAKDQSEFSLTDEEIIKLSKWACQIEDHYQNPQDIEWAKDGKTKELFIVQSRPETIHSLERKAQEYQEYEINPKSEPIVNGIAVGNKIGQGKVRIIPNVAQISQFKPGEVLVTNMTDPDWMPVMRTASAIVTNEGSKTCHAAIVSRELGTPCVVGTKNATKILKQGQEATVDCSQGSGKVYAGKIPFAVKKYDLQKLPQIKTKIMLNVGTPDSAFKASFLPNSGVGLARVEFIFADKIKVHPLALYNFNKIKDKKLKSSIEKMSLGYADKKDFFISKLSEGIAQIGAAFYPKPVIVRFSDFKTNEYKALIGGLEYEPEESNPMIGWRGASRYYDENFQPAFEMECQAIKRVREEFGLSNVWTMIPFCRTVEEGKKVIKIMAENGLEKGKDGLKIMVMCEIPSNVVLADQFLEIFDGMSIGSNDLTQLTLGLDRDAGFIAKIGNEQNAAVKELVKKAIRACKEKGKYCGICGQAPSDYVDFAEFLIEEGIESMSLNPDSVMRTIFQLSKKNNE